MGLTGVVWDRWQPPMANSVKPLKNKALKNEGSRFKALPARSAGGS